VQGEQALISAADSAVKIEKTAYSVQADGGDVPLYSAAWRMLRPTTGKPLGPLGRGCFLEDRVTPYPAAVLTRAGKGALPYVPAALFKDFDRNRYPRRRAFVGDLMKALAGKLEVSVDAPVAVDVALRRKGHELIVHLMNRASGTPNQPSNGAVDEIPALGPVTVTMRLAARPKSVELALEPGRLKWTFARGAPTVVVPSVRIHAAVVVETQGPMVQTPESHAAPR